MSDEKKPPFQAPYSRHILMCSGRYCDADRKSIPLYNKLPSLLGEMGQYDNPERIKRGIAPCLGVCAGGPLLAVYPDGTWYHHVDEALLKRIIAEHFGENRPISEHIFHQLPQPQPEPRDTQDE